MTEESVEPVRRRVTVEVSREHAFRVFTERFDTWWPRSHHTGGGELVEALIEPRAGGRWYARNSTGQEENWGRVLAWEPPGRVVLAWQLDADWQYDPGLETEIEVRFEADGEHRTQVTLVHGWLERYGSRAAEVRRAIGGESGWTGILTAFTAVVGSGSTAAAGRSMTGVDSSTTTGV